MKVAAFLILSGGLTMTGPIPDLGDLGSVNAVYPVADEPTAEPRVVIVKTTGYDKDGKAKYTVEKKAPVTLPNNTTVTIEVVDPDTGRVTYKKENVPAHLTKTGDGSVVWAITRAYTSGANPDKGSRITGEDGRTFTVTEKLKNTTADGLLVCKVKETTKKPE